VAKSIPLHVQQNSYEMWVVRHENSSRAMQVFRTETQATNYAKRRGKGKVEIVIHNRDGTVKRFIKPEA
jgi:hypothetical protein